MPHIFGKTDADVAYGLAWANAEDDFETIQSVYLAGSSMLSKRIGNKGIGADFLSQFIGSRELIDSLYEKKISLTISLNCTLDKLGTSKKHSKIFKRTLSRLYEMTLSKKS